MRISKRVQGDEGYAIAEFAVAVPALIAVLSICIWTIGLTFTKFELENFSNNAVRTIARGEPLSASFLEAAPTGMTFDVSEVGNSVQVRTKLVQQIPIINKQIELSSTAESMSEVYVE